MDIGWDKGGLMVGYKLFNLVTKPGVVKIVSLDS